MKKIIAITCLIVCLVMLCTACSHKSMSAAEYYEDYGLKENYPTLHSLNKINDLSKLNHQSGKNMNEILVFTNNAETEKTKFYNAELDSFVLELSSDKLEKYGALTFYYESFFYTVESKEVDEDVEYSLNLYDAKGSLVAKKDITYSEYTFFSAENYFSSSVCDLFRFDGKVYRVNTDGTASVVLDNPFLGSIPSGLIKTDNYYYDIDDEEFTVYDHSLEQVLYWENPCDEYRCGVFLLSGDHILVQSMDILPFDSNKYDITYNGSKMNLTSIIINVATGKEKEVDLDFVVEDVECFDIVRHPDYLKNNYQPEDVENLATIYYIVDEKVNDNDEKYVALSGRTASIKFEIAAEFDNIPDALGNGYYTYTSDNGNKYLLNSNLEIVSKINGWDSASGRNNNFIVMNNKIYDYNLNLVYDLDANDKVLIRLMANSFIICDKDGDANSKEYHLRTSTGSNIEIEDYYESSSQYYVTREYNTSDYTYKYSFYNSNGEKIASIDDVSESAEFIYTYDDNAAFLIRVTIDGNKTYYKLSK